MENKDIVRKLTDIEEMGEEKALEVQEKMVKFLVFRLGNRELALSAEMVREILIDVPLFFVPFVPPYVRGFINRHGEPYTVLDMNVLFEKSRQESRSYLILNIEEDQLAFLISDVQEIMKVPESEIHDITSTLGHEKFFNGSFSAKGKEVFVLDLDNIITRLEQDIETAG